MLFECFFVGVNFVAIPAHQLEVVQFVAFLLICLRVGKVGDAGVLKKKIVSEIKF